MRGCGDQCTRMIYGSRSPPPPWETCDALGGVGWAAGGCRLNYFEKFSHGNTKPQNIISSEGAGKGQPLKKYCVCDSGDVKASESSPLSLGWICIQS